MCSKEMESHARPFLSTFCWSILLLLRRAGRHLFRHFRPSLISRISRVSPKWPGPPSFIGRRHFSQIRRLSNKKFSGLFFKRSDGDGTQFTMITLSLRPGGEKNQKFFFRPGIKAMKNSTGLAAFTFRLLRPVAASCCYTFGGWGEVSRRLHLIMTLR